MITEQESIEIILSSFPDFKDKWEEHLEFWLNDPDRPYGLDIAAFSQYTVELIKDNKSLDEVVELTERMLIEGNDAVKYAFRFNFLENITNQMDNIPLERFLKKLKPKSIAFCRELDKFWGSKTPGL